MGSKMSTEKEKELDQFLDNLAADLDDIQCSTTINNSNGTNVNNQVNVNIQMVVSNPPTTTTGTTGTTTTGRRIAVVPAISPEDSEDPYYYRPTPDFTPPDSPDSSSSDELEEEESETELNKDLNSNVSNSWFHIDHDPVPVPVPVQQQQSVSLNQQQQQQVPSIAQQMDSPPGPSSVPEEVVESSGSPAGNQGVELSSHGNGITADEIQQNSSKMMENLDPNPNPTTKLENAATTADHQHSKPLDL